MYRCRDKEIREGCNKCVRVNLSYNHAMGNENRYSQVHRNGHQSPTDNFAEILGMNESDEIHRFERKFVPFEGVNVLPQGRKTFEDIEELAENISNYGLMNLPIVATLDEEHAIQYLNVINTLWGTEFKIEELTSLPDADGSPSYTVLIAGERRYRACKELRDAGRFEEVFGRDELEVSYRNNIPPMEAIFRQASENTYMSVPPHEEAVYYSEMYRIIKMADPNYSLAQFARKVGRNERKVREALRFCMLPQQIQDYVKDGFIPYGTACEIARLAQADAGEEDIEFFANKALTGRMRVDEFRNVINGYFNSRKGTMFEIFQDTQTEETRRASFRKVVKREYVMGLWSFIHYFRHVMHLFETGKLGEELAPFSDGSPRRLFGELLVLQRDLLPHFEKVMSKGEFRRAAKTIEELEERFEGMLPDDGQMHEGISLFLTDY